ncbi:MAG: hypothetical protein RJB38_1624 [Pseudomonadota bacterium]|jgi:alanine racemase
MIELRTRAQISSQALRANVRQLSKAASSRSLLAMVKADAYGHGAVWASRILSKEPGVSALGVATFSEAVEIRLGLQESEKPLPILVFSGSAPWPQKPQDSGWIQLLERFALTPVISSIEDWRQFHSGFPRASGSLRVPFELKFNTGMNRLGIDLEYLPEIRRDLLALAQRGIYPRGVLSHLAVGEDCHHPLSRIQAQRFEGVCSELGAFLPDSVEFHLANSAATLRSEKWRFHSRVQRVRPGLALYGIPPANDRSRSRLQPVLTLEAPVILIREIGRGETVGYGARYRASKRERVAILAAGYGEGIHRAWSAPGSSARVRLQGRLQPFLGPISMDMCAIRASSSVRVGHWAQLWGAGIDPWKQAAAAHTIPYEILTSLSRRVQRIYG